MLEVTVAADHQAMTTRVTTSGTVTVPSGEWECEVVASGGRGTSTASDTRSGAGVLDIPDVDHIAFRGSSAREVSVEGRLIRDGQTIAVDRPPQIPVAARPALAGMVGAVVYPILPVAPYTTTANALAVIDALPAGLDCVRVALPWVSLQPSSSAWDPTLVAHLDTFFTGCASRSLKVLLTVGTTPTWARTGGTNQAPPDSAATFGAWVDSILDRWESTVDIVAIDPWNEPKLIFTGTDAQMVALVQASKSAAAGRALVSTPSLALADAPYLQRLFDAGLTSADFDAVDFHPYGLAFTGSNMRPIDPRFPPVPDDRASSPLAGLHDLLDVLAANDSEGKTLIASETGASPFKRGATSVADANYQLDPDTARVWLDTQLDQMRRAGCAYVCTYVGRDPTAPDASWATRYGLLDFDGYRRPTWTALSVHV